MTNVVSSGPARRTPTSVGHVNLFTDHVQASLELFRDVLGLDLVYIEEDLDGYFFSNGNTHHDAAFFATTKTERRDADGEVQISTERGSRAGVNHLAFEMTDVSALIEAYDAITQSGVAVNRSFDHGISKSIYMTDPSGVGVEMYADIVEDWRGYYRDHGGDVVTTVWNPNSDQDTTRIVRAGDHAGAQRAGHGVFPCVRFARASIVTRDLEASRSFYKDVVGLNVAHEARDWAILNGTNGEPVIGLFEDPDRPVGLHHFSFLVDSSADLDRGVDRATQGTVKRTVKNPHKHSVFLSTPDGLGCEVIAADSLGDLNDLSGMGSLDVLMEIY